MNTPADIEALQEQFHAIERDATALTDGLTEELGAWHETADSWSVAECFDHLATGNRIYLDALHEGAFQARKRGRLRRGPARPGLIGHWFANYLEPPARAPFRLKAPRNIVPRKGPALGDASARFLQGHHQVEAYLAENADLDLARARFANPFIRGVRFSLATGLYVIAAHERRHLWQGWRVRRSACSTGARLPRVC